MRLFARNSIGSKIFAAFLAMGAIAGLLGAFAYLILSAAGDMVVQTYDGPLMSINFARAASLDFALMQNHLLERKLAPDTQKAEIDRTIEDRAVTFFEDLNVARERSQTAAELETIGQIQTLVQEWQGVRREAQMGVAVDDKLEALGKEILDQFEKLAEIIADFSFVGRREAVWSISYYKYASIGVTVLALLLAMGITLILARKIVRPLSAAAAVADQIADGKLQTQIPTGAKDETGILLRSMTVMQKNIREMVERETARAQSAEVRLTDALENSGEEVILVGSTGKVVMANSQVSRFFPSMTKHLAGLGYESVVRLIDEQLTAQREISSTEWGPMALYGAEAIRTERQLNSGRWIRFAQNRTSDGGFILLLSDFTEIKNREINFRLAKQAAEDASAAKSRFLSNMSHELRTPLNAIIGFSEIIASQMFGKVENKRYVEYAADILGSGRHLLDVINDVLELSRSEAGKLPFNAELVDLRDVLFDCAKMVREQGKAANLRFIVPEFAEPLLVLGEKAKLRQIFLNLLSNAVKFTDSGGSISIDVGPRDADIADRLWVSVTDTGIGMSAEDVKIAFTPFGQVDNRLERRYQGTGLGLPLTKALVELHDGVLVIESARGKGTAVRVGLPIAHPSVELLGAQTRSA